MRLFARELLKHDAKQYLEHEQHVISKDEPSTRASKLVANYAIRVRTTSKSKHPHTKHNRCDSRSHGRCDRDRPLLERLNGGE